MTGQKNVQKKSAQARRGVFIGAYIPAELKAALENEATNQHRTSSNLLTMLLSDILLNNKATSSKPLGSEQNAAVAA